MWKRVISFLLVCIIPVSLLSCSVVTDEEETEAEAVSVVSEEPVETQERTIKIVTEQPSEEPQTSVEVHEVPIPAETESTSKEQELFDQISDYFSSQTENAEKPYADVDIMSTQEALDYIKECMINRETSFTVNTEPMSVDTDNVLESIYNTVVAHTGVPDEGDYLLTQLSNIEFNQTKYLYANEVVYEKYDFDVQYCTTKQQEDAVGNYIGNLLAELNVSSLPTDYEKVLTIYSWITDCVEYDYDNLDDESYLLKYSAYSALFDHKAVCQGCSALLYRMLLTAGIDCRCIYGQANGGGHVWNIVNIDGVYYNVDVTWDLGYPSYDYWYFLKGSADFDTTHFRYSQYLTNEFLTKYAVPVYNYS